MLEDPSGGMTFPARRADHTPTLPHLLLPHPAPQVSVSPKDTGSNALSCQQPKAMPKHPQPTPPTPDPAPPTPWGGPGALRLPRTSSGLPVALCSVEGAIWGACSASPGKTTTELQLRTWGERHPRAWGTGGRLLCPLCNCVAERLPRSCLCVSPGQLRGAGDGGR